MVFCVAAFVTGRNPSLPCFFVMRGKGQLWTYELRQAMLGWRAAWVVEHSCSILLREHQEGGWAIELHCKVVGGSSHCNIVMAAAGALIVSLIAVHWQPRMHGDGLSFFFCG